MNVKKRYVKVMTMTEEDGAVKPLLIYWDEDRRYPVDAILDVRPAASRKAGGQGLRYLIRIGKTETEIYYEDPAWFVIPISE
ncbi:hypothetical protein EUCA11A_40840 [Eubacterium callanderi]|uniref:hypothetical protein n=1 Tax=Eubacterium callanderi TaxID=53442 RepID=UPI0029FEF885|nr:hypothetical protein [Eubacterium callanderi]WPK69894.1 hypothetical protein EUCA2A_40840 [Eubacterium callanderi]WPK74192.1 hypothetical protein EUCA11A_40840 [Eubacterium callanderi]